MLYIVCYLFFSMFVYNKKALCIIHNAYLKLILISNIFYLFWRARKMRGHPVASQNSGNTFVVCFSDIFEMKKSSRVSEIVLWGWYFGKKIFFVLISTLLWATLTRKLFEVSVLQSHLLTRKVS